MADIIGERFGKLVIVGQAENRITNRGDKIPMMVCDCDCGNHGVIINKYHITRKNNPTRSCGCESKKAAAINGYKTKKENIYNVDGDYGIGWTHNTNREFYFDLADYDLIRPYCWLEVICPTNGYHSIEARNPETKKRIKMSALLGYRDNSLTDVDHKDRNPFNNQRDNLRMCTHAENMRNRTIAKNNTSGIIGVNYHKKTSKWRARLVINGTEFTFGSYDDINDAIRARLKAEVKYFGEFAPQKHLYTQYGVVDGTIRNDIIKES